MTMGEEIEISVASEETRPLTSDEDPTVDPMKSGFQWYKPATNLDASHSAGGHKWTISGHDMQILTTTVPPGGEVVTEVGTFMYMHPSMTTEVELTLCSKGGCGEGCSRMCGGESCVKVYLKNESSDEGYVGLTPNFPAKVIPLKFGTNVPSGTAIIAQGGAIMSQLGDVDVGCDLDCGLTTCCCAGLGLCRQKLSGSDDSIAFLAAGGTIVYRTLKAGETVTVDSHSVLAIEESVTLGISLNGRFCTCLCGGEGCFSTTLTGPGQIWMQSMNFYKFRDAVQVTVTEDMDRGDDSGNGGD